MLGPLQMLGERSFAGEAFGACSACGKGLRDDLPAALDSSVQGVPGRDAQPGGGVWLDGIEICELPEISAGCQWLASRQRVCEDTPFAILRL